MMKLFLMLACLFFTACSAIPREEIKQDPLNQTQITKIQQQIELDTVKKAQNDTEYTECINKLNKINKLISKNSFTTTDYKTLTEIFKDDTYGYYSPGTGHYSQLDISPFSCNIYIDKEIYTKQLDEYCDEKYNNESTLTTIIAFPFRLTNFVLTIGTLGLFPVFHGSAYVNYNRCNEMSEQLNFTITDIKQEFTEADADNITNKFKTYCKNNYFKPKQKLENKQCKDVPEKGCLQDFSGYSVSIFGTRDEGIIVDAFLDPQSYFIYDKSDYYDGQTVKNTDYYYEYTGIYNDTFQKLPAFKKSNQKKIPFNGHCEALKKDGNL